MGLIREGATLVLPWFVLVSEYRVGDLSDHLDGAETWRYKGMMGGGGGGVYVSVSVWRIRCMREGGRACLSIVYGVLKLHTEAVGYLILLDFLGGRIGIYLPQVNDEKEPKARCSASSHVHMHTCTSRGTHIRG